MNRIIKIGEVAFWNLVNGERGYICLEEEQARGLTVGFGYKLMADVDESQEPPPWRFVEVVSIDMEDPTAPPDERNEHVVSGMAIVNVRLHATPPLHERTYGNRNEAAFSEVWAHYCIDICKAEHPVDYIMNGDAHGADGVADVSSEHDRVVAAGMAQWLGSDDGMQFMRSALREVGYEIVRTGKTPGN